MKASGLLTSCFAASVLAAGLSCDRVGPPAPAMVERANGGVTEVKPGEEFRPISRQTIYVPAYPSVRIAEGKQPFNLAVTLSVRNTDLERPIVVSSVNYHGSDGRLVRSYLAKPVRVAPLAAFEVFIKESDTSGGSSTSFLVEWISELPGAAPVVETVMIGTMGTQGISFVCPGREIPVNAPDTR